MDWLFQLTLLQDHPRQFVHFVKLKLVLHQLEYLHRHIGLIKFYLYVQLEFHGTKAFLSSF